MQLCPHPRGLCLVQETCSLFADANGQALVLEDEVKASVWFNASGVATVLWLAMLLGYLR